MKRTVRNTLIALATFSSSAFAAGGAASGGGNLLLALFIGFFSLIVVFQLVPATIMLIGMFRGILGRDSKQVTNH